MNPLAPQYTLGESDEEHRRLVALASFEADRVVDACRRAGVRPGATAVDLGCGPMGALQALSEVVGASGQVIGIDASAAAIERARGIAPHLKLIHANVNEVALQADVVYSRLFLLHQRDPITTLRHVRTFLREGGVLVAHEPSDELSGAPASQPHVPAMTRVWELVIGAAQARGAQTHFGRCGRSMLTEAGFQVESHRAYSVHYPPFIGFDIPRVALHSLKPAIREHGLATEAEVNELDAELQDAKSRSGIEWISSPLMFEWIAS